MRIHLYHEHLAGLRSYPIGSRLARSTSTPADETPSLRQMLRAFSTYVCVCQKSRKERSRASRQRGLCEIRVHSSLSSYWIPNHGEAAARLSHVFREGREVCATVCERMLCIGVLMEANAGVVLSALWTMALSAVAALFCATMMVPLCVFLRPMSSLTCFPSERFFVSPARTLPIELQTRKTCQRRDTFSART